MSVHALPDPDPSCCRLSTACISQLPGGATPTVAVVFDLGGEVAACVADVALLEARLLPPLLRRPDVAVALAAAPVAMLDGNLNEAALEVSGCGYEKVLRCFRLTEQDPRMPHPTCTLPHRRRAGRRPPRACRSGLSLCLRPSLCGPPAC